MEIETGDVFEEGDDFLDLPLQRNVRLREIVSLWEEYCSVGNPVTGAFILSDFANKMTHLGWQLECEDEDSRRKRELSNAQDVRYCNYQVHWSMEDLECVATVAEFPSLSWVDFDPVKALRGLVELVDSMTDEDHETDS